MNKKIIPRITLTRIDSALSGGMACYDLAEIKSKLSKEDNEIFEDHFNGKTMMITDDGRTGVYCSDWSQFCYIHRDYSMLRNK